MILSITIIDDDGTVLVDHKRSPLGSGNREEQTELAKGKVAEAMIDAWYALELLEPRV